MTQKQKTRQAPPGTKIKNHDALRALEQRCAELERRNLHYRDLLQQAEAMYVSIVETLNDPAFIIDSDFRAALANEKFCSWLAGINPGNENPIGKNLFHLLALSERVREGLQNVFRNGQAAITEDGHSVNGKKIALEIRMLPLRGNG